MRSAVKDGNMFMKRIFFKIALPYVLVSVAVMLAGAAKGYAHPHVFVTGSVDPVINEQNLAEVRVRWTFDEFISSAALGFAVDQDRTINLDEGKGFWGQGLPDRDSLKYYVAIEIDGVRYEQAEPGSLGMSVAGSCIRYSFTIPVGMPVGTSAKVWLLDPGNYIAFSIDAGNCNLIREAGDKGELRINEEQYITKAVIIF